MDLDAFVTLRADRWGRLEKLARRRRLSGAEADELIGLYQAGAGDLSRLRTSAPDPVVIGRLSYLLGRARAAVTGGHELSLAPIARFLLVSLPAAFYRIRWWTVAGMVLFLLVATGYALWALHTPGALDAIAPPEDRARYAQQAFTAYYSEYSGADFMGMVWSNNAFIAARMVGMGVTGFLPTVTLLQNATGIGGAGAMLAEHGMSDVFWGSILPHGQLEMTAIFVAWAAGTKLFWALVAPGARTRGQAFAAEGRAMITVALGLVLVLGLSGVVEGFVPRTDLPAGVKIGIGTLALAAYWTYTIVLGRRAVADGETGDVLSEHREATVAVAD